MDKENKLNRVQWDIIDKFFKENPYCLVDHHIQTYNKFFNNDLFNIFKEKNPIKIMKNMNEETEEYDLQCKMFLGGKNAEKIYYGKPIIYDSNKTDETQNSAHFMFPNEARLRNMTYGFTIHFDIVLDFKIKKGDIFEESTMEIEKVFLGTFPIMLHSNLCIFNKMNKYFAYNSGECKNDKGGYFIIDGKEKAIIPQEQFANNMININDKGNDTYSHTADIRSVSEDASKPVRTMSVRIVKEDTKYTNNQIVVNIPNVRKPIPLFIVMRALGILSDKKIIEMCLIDLKRYENYIDLFIPSIHDANKIFTQNAAIEYIATFTKGKTENHVLEILMDYFLPHIGVDNFIDKAYFLGHIVFNLLQVYKKARKPTDRDNFKYKRIETTGTLIYNLFKEYFKLQHDHILKTFDKEYYYHIAEYNADYKSLFTNFYQSVFKERIVESGFKKAFKGNWGATEHTKRLGALQDLNRLSFNSALSHLRKVNLDMDASAKVVAPRLLHSSQWGLIDPLDTPDGGNVGLHKHLAIMTHISTGYSKEPLIDFLFKNAFVKPLSSLKPKQIANMIKIIVNGHWIGCHEEPIDFVNMFKKYRRISLIPIQTSINWSIENSTIYINTDGGRLCRPILYIDQDRQLSLNVEQYKSQYSWLEMITGNNNKKVENFSINDFTVKMHYMAMLN